MRWQLAWSADPVTRVPRQAASALRILAVWHVAAVSGDTSEINPPTREEVSACG